MVDFSEQEFLQRYNKAQEEMQREGLDALLFCTEAEVRYFSGFRTLFWQSPTRPWFLILPAKGEPIAVIPQIGADLMSRTWVKDIRTWSSPHPTDDGVSLLAQALKEFPRIGMPMGDESSLRMPMKDFDRVKSAIKSEFIDCSLLLQKVRRIKSASEIAITEEICHIASSVFDKAEHLFFQGQTLSEAFKAFKIALLSEGAEEVPYIVGGAGQGGYSDVISPPTDSQLREGDILMLDTGSTLKGYFCDFDRNFALGFATDEAKATYDKLWLATEAGINHATAGTTCAELFNAMHQVLGGGASDVGRYGHGLGIQLTEWPSIYPGDQTVLEPGMIMTLEPSVGMSQGRMMVHEENILITEGAPLLLSKRASNEIPII